MASISLSPSAATPACGRKVGDVDFGPARTPFDENAVTLDWYDYLFQGKQNEFATDKPVQHLRHGRKQVARRGRLAARPRQSRLGTSSHSAGKANTASGDGALSTEAARSAMRRTPSSTIPAIPCPPSAVRSAAIPIHLAARPSRSERSGSPPRRTRLFHAAPRPGHRSHRPRHARPLRQILRRRHRLHRQARRCLAQRLRAESHRRHSPRRLPRIHQRRPTPIVPGQVYEYKIDLWSTSNVFLKGHRIRLEVSSSNFPRFDRNLNTGKNAAESSEFVKATNTILHDTQHPSALILPIVPR